MPCLPPFMIIHYVVMRRSLSREFIVDNEDNISAYYPRSKLNLWVFYLLFKFRCRF